MKIVCLFLIVVLKSAWGQLNEKYCEGWNGRLGWGWGSELNSFNEGLLCEKYPGDENSLQITFDCTLGFDDSLWLWSAKFLTETRKLIIQNCQKLNLYTELAHSYRKDLHFPENLQFLHVVNVSNLNLIKGNLAEKELDEWFYYYYHSEFELTVCLPETVIFENVEILRMEFDQYYACVKPNYKLNILKLRNVSIDSLSTYFSSVSSKISKLEMDNVIIEKVANKAIYNLNQQAIISIKNSVINNVEGTFLECNNHKVTISNNTFKNLYDSNTFVLKADQIIFTGNDVIVHDNALDLTSADIKITNNIFRHVSENAFSNINFAAAQKIQPKSYNFSNNIIYSIESGGLDFKMKNTLDNVTIFNNSIDCVCRNMYWFHSISEKTSDFQKNFMKSKWVQKRNENKCLNLPNCYISKVLKNYQELCDVDFDCEESFTDISATSNNCSDSNPVEKTLMDFLNYNNEVGEKNSKLIQILMNEIRENKIFDDSNDSLEEGKNFSASFFVESNFKQERLQIFYDISLSKICLVVLTCVFCLIVFLIIIIKLSKFKFTNIVSKTRRRKNLVTETEMNPSSVIELCSTLD